MPSVSNEELIVLAVYMPPQAPVVGHALRSMPSKSSWLAIERRLAYIRDKNWAEADRIRDELQSRQVRLKDGKDSVTGERITTWELSS